MNMRVKMKRFWMRLPKDLRSLFASCLLFATLFIIYYIFVRSQPTPWKEELPVAARPAFKPSISIAHKQFYLDNQRVQFFSGAIHYFRIVPEEWLNRLKKMHDAGLNAIETYVPWNLHEEVKGQFNFNGRLDIRRFIKMADDLGLHVFVRPGPYICAEWELGGLPSWLLHDPHMVLRSSYKPYLLAVHKFWHYLSMEIKDLQYHYGGPIVAFQVENEYGSYGSDMNYMETLQTLLNANGFCELHFTSENEDGLNKVIPGVLQTANLQDLSTAKKLFPRLEELQPDKPLFVMELWSGWFDHWSENHHTTSVQGLQEVLEYIISKNASVNFYMFTGGTNFGFMNGANEGVLEATITSYDYNAPISESGELTDKYHMIANILRPLNKVKGQADMPRHLQSFDYGNIKMDAYLTLNNLLEMLKITIKSTNVMPMELLPINNGGGQGYGFIVYRKVIPKGQAIEIKGFIQDKCVILLNGNNIGMLTKEINNPVIALTTRKDTNTLDIIVENTGRNNYVHTTGATLDDQRKGIIGDVYLDDVLLEDWIIYPLELKEDFMEKVLFNGDWMPTKMSTLTGSLLSSPVLFKGDLFINGHSNPQDTYLDVTNWGKGVAFINNFNIGRYWPSVGPQKRLYIPGPLLKRGRNKILLFELEKNGGNVELVDRSDLG